MRIHWESFGAGDVTVLLAPTWSIIPSRFWKLQVPHLARRYRVITFDGRGTGLSDAPVGSEAYTHFEFADDLGAVLDRDRRRSRRARRPVVRGDVDDPVRRRPSRPSQRCGGDLPGRPTHTGHDERHVHPFDEPTDADTGWARYNTYYWRRDYRGFLEFFFAQMFHEPHSTKQIEDCVEWGLEIPVPVLMARPAG